MRVVAISAPWEFLDQLHLHSTLGALNLREKPGGRKAVFAALYLSEGGPIGFIWWALPTWLRTQGVPVEQIAGLTALLVLPWTFKFLWAPLIDRFGVQRGRLRWWIAGAQLLMGLTLLPLFWLSPANDFQLVWWLLLAHAMAAATQDVGVDALAIHSAKPEELGHLNGCMQAGMLLGRSVFGGGALMLAVSFGWNGIFVGLIACTWGSMALLAFCAEPKPGSSGAGGESVGTLLRAFVGSRTAWWGLAFALIAGCGFEAVGILAGPYLVDRTVPQETIGLFFALPVVGAMLVGGLIGGRAADRFGKVRTVRWFLVLLAMMVAGIGLMDGIGVMGSTGRIAWLAVLYFGIGLFTASSYALFMSISDKRMGATQFSAFMGATNGCEAWAGWSGGMLAGRFGYPVAFVAMAVLSLIGTVCLRRLKGVSGAVISDR